MKNINNGDILSCETQIYQSSQFIIFTSNSLSTFKDKTIRCLDKIEYKYIYIQLKYLKKIFTLHIRLICSEYSKI